LFFGASSWFSGLRIIHVEMATPTAEPVMKYGCRASGQKPATAEPAVRMHATKLRMQ